jgi:predicted lipoprotein with Yx(FWY)xxD motif
MQPSLQECGSAHLRRWLRALPAVPLAALLLVSGCGGSAGSATGSQAGHGPKVTVIARSVPGVGQVLVTSAGYTLYMFQPDDRRSVTCTGVCTGTWPPLMLPSGGQAVAGPGVKSSLLGSDPDPSGGRVVTYDGWPLYTYTGDVQPGQATGQAIDLNGGEWYVLRPSGAPLIPAP